MSNEQVKNNKKGLWISILVTVILIPAVFIASPYLGDRNMYITSVIVMILSMVPFFASFESHKPHARELVILSVMCALTVASRAAFVWAPGFKPMAGVIMITAMVFGPQAGFMTGSLSMIISNMIFGQGPWTPWQMFAYGMAGFITGFLARVKIMDEKKPIKCAIIGFIMMVLIIGPILDTSTVFSLASMINAETIGAIYLSGLPINISQGIATAITLTLLTKPVTEKLIRIKIKYGMME